MDFSSQNYIKNNEIKSKGNWYRGSIECHNRYISIPEKMPEATLLQRIPSILKVIFMRVRYLMHEVQGLSPKPDQ